MYIQKRLFDIPSTFCKIQLLRLYAHKQMGKPASKLPIPGVENVILVSSAKGGVAVNLALALRNQLENQSVGLMDADIFGPSIPKMMNLEELQPEIDEKKRIIPLLSYQLKCMSIGFLVDSKSAIVWRGLMVMSAIQQLLHQVAWGPLHTLVVDMPPGTGDVQLSLCQNIEITGSIIVTTPQAVATSDTYRGICMLRKLQVPIYGIVENMTEFICPSCGHHEALFSRQSGTKSDDPMTLAQLSQLPVLAQIPIDPRLIISGDCGRPLMISHPESKTAQIYKTLAQITLDNLNNKCQNKQ